MRAPGEEDEDVLRRVFHLKPQYRVRHGDLYASVYALADPNGVAYPAVPSKLRDILLRYLRASANVAPDTTRDIELLMMAPRSKWPEFVIVARGQVHQQLQLRAHAGVSVRSKIAKAFELEEEELDPFIIVQFVRGLGELFSPGAQPILDLLKRCEGDSLLRDDEGRPIIPICEDEEQSATHSPHVYFTWPLDPSKVTSEEFAAHEHNRFQRQFEYELEYAQSSSPKRLRL